MGHAVGEERGDSAEGRSIGRCPAGVAATEGYADANRATKACTR